MNEERIQKTMEEFAAFSSEEKRELCLTVLSEAKSLGGLFLELYDLVDSGNATDTDYANIYESALVVLSKTEEKKTEESIRRLEDAKNRLSTMRTRENLEKNSEMNVAETLFTAMV
jgi:hypothetical protein